MIGQARPADSRRDTRGWSVPPAGLTCFGAHAAPTEPTTTTIAALRGDESELYRRHHRRLLRVVTRNVIAPRELIEDACQNAWAILLRRQPDREAVFAWLCEAGWV